MSTVVFYNGALYADTQCTVQKISLREKTPEIVEITRKTKIGYYDDHACSGPYILGFTGNVWAIDDFVEWSKKGRSSDKNYTTASSCDIFEYDGEMFRHWSTKYVETVGRFSWWCRMPVDLYKFYIVQERKYTLADEANGESLRFTMGSGGDFAMGYLAAGTKDPIQSIVTASKYDKFTNDTIEAVGLYSKKVNQIHPIIS